MDQSQGFQPIRSQNNPHINQSQAQMWQVYPSGETLQIIVRKLSFIVRNWCRPNLLFISSDNGDFLHFFKTDDRGSRRQEIISKMIVFLPEVNFSVLEPPQQPQP